MEKKEKKKEKMSNLKSKSEYMLGLLAVLGIFMVMTLVLTNFTSKGTYSASINCSLLTENTCTSPCTWTGTTCAGGVIEVGGGATTKKPTATAATTTCSENSAYWQSQKDSCVANGGSWSWNTCSCASGSVATTTKKPTTTATATTCSETSAYWQSQKDSCVANGGSWSWNTCSCASGSTATTTKKPTTTAAPTCSETSAYWQSAKDQCVTGGGTWSWNTCTCTGGSAATTTKKPTTTAAATCSENSAYWQSQKDSCVSSGKSFNWATCSCEVSCAAGTYPNSVNTQCYQCPERYYCPGNGKKFGCPAGQISDAGSSKLSDCHDIEEDITIKIVFGSTTRTCVIHPGEKRCSVTVPGGPSKEGYTFTGWGGSSTCTRGSVSEGSTVYFSANATFFACYEQGDVDTSPKCYCAKNTGRCGMYEYSSSALQNGDTWELKDDSVCTNAFDKNKCRYSVVGTVQPQDPEELYPWNKPRYLCKYVNIVYNASSSETNESTVRQCCNAIGWSFDSPFYNTSGAGGGAYQYCTICEGGDDPPSDPDVPDDPTRTDDTPTEDSCYKCTVNGTDKYVTTDSPEAAARATGASSAKDCSVTAASYCKTPTPKPTTKKATTAKSTTKCFECVVNGATKYVTATDVNKAISANSATSCKEVNSSFCNTPTNPKTGTVAVIIAWLIGLSAIGYAVWYFKKIDSIDK